MLVRVGAGGTGGAGVPDRDRAGEVHLGDHVEDADGLTVALDGIGPAAAAAAA